MKNRQTAVIIEMPGSHIQDFYMDLVRQIPGKNRKKYVVFFVSACKKGFQKRLSKQVVVPSYEHPTSIVRFAG